MNTINRRSFLQAFSSGVAAATASSHLAVSVQNQLYLNKALGIGFRIPKKWEFSQIKDFGEMRDSQILSDFINPDIEQIIREQTDPIVVSGLEPESDAHFSPGVAFYVEHIELFNHERIDNIANAERKLYSDILPDYSLDVVTRDFSINDFESIKLESQFTYATDKIAPISVRNISIITQRRPFIYTLRAFDSPQNSMNAKPEIEGIIKSLYYA